MEQCADITMLDALVEEVRAKCSFQSHEERAKIRAERRKTEKARDLQRKAARKEKANR